MHCRFSGNKMNLCARGTRTERDTTFASRKHLLRWNLTKTPVFGLTNIFSPQVTAVHDIMGGSLSYDNNDIHPVPKSCGKQGSLEMGLKSTFYLIETESPLYLQPDGGGLFFSDSSLAATSGRNAPWLRIATLSVTTTQA